MNCHGIDTGFSDGVTRRIYDGLKLTVQFYENNSRLIQVSNKSGVPIQRLKNWLKDVIELSNFDREKLLNCINKKNK